jgi:hypothetical protein
MSATQWAAWVGACSGLCSLLWNIYTKLTSGPKLDVTAFPGMKMMPPPPNNPTFLSVTVHNVGTATTTITNLGLCTYESWWARKRRKGSQHFVVANYQGPALPLKLEVGGEWRALMEQDGRFDKLLLSDKLWCTVFHSFAKRPVEVKINRTLSD